MLGFFLVQAINLNGYLADMHFPAIVVDVPRDLVLVPSAPAPRMVNFFRATGKRKGLISRVPLAVLPLTGISHPGGFTRGKFDFQWKNGIKIQYIVVQQLSCTIETGPVS